MCDYIFGKENIYIFSSPGKKNPLGISHRQHGIADNGMMFVAYLGPMLRA